MRKMTVKIGVMVQVDDLEPVFKTASWEWNASKAITEGIIIDAEYEVVSDTALPAPCLALEAA